MDLKWLEDFISLAETHSFSRSAALRHVTQPAFSRRIRSLESWLGVDLIDRTAYPTRLTPAGELFHGQALEILAQLSHARALLRGQQSVPSTVNAYVGADVLSKMADRSQTYLRRIQHPADRRQCARCGDGAGKRRL